MNILQTLTAFLAGNYMFCLTVLLIIVLLGMILSLCIMIHREETRSGVLAANSYIKLPKKSAVKDKAKAKPDTKPPISTNADLIQLNLDLAPYGFAYNEKGDYFYSLKECWQREFGYCRMYDEAAAPLSMIIDCEPIYFNYNGKSWLIEFWKGQYGMTTGAEVGIYNTREFILPTIGYIRQSAWFKSAEDEEMLPVSYTLYQNGEPVIARKDKAWWLTGFKLGMLSKPSKLTMDIRITFPTRGMLSAFLDGLDDAGYSRKDFTVSSLTVAIIYDKPHTPQPDSRGPAADYTMLKANGVYCKLYESITKDYDTTLDKLVYLKNKAPVLYDRVIKVGHPKELYNAYPGAKDTSQK